MTNSLRQTNLKAIKGDTVLIEGSVTRDDEIVDLTGAKLWFTVKRNHTDEDADAVARKGTSNTTLSGITITDAVNGEVVISLEPEDSEDLEDGTVTLVYDLQLLETTGTITTVAFGRFLFLDQVTLASA